LLEREKGQGEAQPGPGTYENRKHEHINSKGTVWTKDRVERFRKLQKSQIGPGKYQVESVKHDERESSIFKSNTVRTFLDTLMYGSQNEDVVKIRQKKHYKAPAPAPGDYNSEQSSFKTVEKIPEEYQFFGSSIDRFANKEKKS